MPGSGGSAASGVALADNSTRPTCAPSTRTFSFTSSQEIRAVTRQLDAWRAAHETFLVSTLVQAEVLSLPKLTKQDIERIEGLLGTMTLLPVDAGVAQLAASCSRQYRVKLADAVIAATAFLQDVPLVTRNIKDFAKIKEITVERV